MTGSLLFTAEFIIQESEWATPRCANRSKTGFIPALRLSLCTTLSWKSAVNTVVYCENTKKQGL